MCVGSLIICCNPNWEAIPSFLEPLYVAMLILLLKPPRKTVRKKLFTIIESIFNSKLLINDSKST